MILNCCSYSYINCWSNNFDMSFDFPSVRPFSVFYKGAWRGRSDCWQTLRSWSCYNGVSYCSKNWSTYI